MEIKTDHNETLDTYMMLDEIRTKSFEDFLWSENSLKNQMLN